MKKLLFVNILGTVLVALIAVGGAYLNARQSHECPSGVYIPNPDDCQSYYECTEGGIIVRCCPGGLYFCEEKQMCTWLWDSECTFDCVVTPNGCGEGGYECWDTVTWEPGMSTMFCGTCSFVANSKPSPGATRSMCR